MRIWLINHYAVPPEYYPLARQTYFAKYLQRKGHEVIIFAASTVHNSDLNLIADSTPYRKLQKNGVKYVVVKCHGYKGNGMDRIFNMTEFALKLPKVCTHFRKPDAIVATSMPPMSCAMGIHLARKYHCKGIAEIADLWPESLIEYGMAKEKSVTVYALRKLEKWIYKNANLTVFTGEGGYDYIVEQNWHHEISREKVKYLNNGIDLEAFDYNKDHFQIEDPDLKNPNIFKVIYTGSIRKVNNVGLLLDVAKHIQNKTVKILIWGDGEELPVLKERVTRENISNICFKGKVEKKYIPYIVSCADLNIAHNNPSKIFRFGISFNKIFDYLAAGRPILCDFPANYNPVIMRNAGIAVETANPNDIAKQIEGFISMSQKELDKYCMNARETAKEYDFERLTTKLLDYISSI